MDSDPIPNARWRDCKHFVGIRAGSCEAGVVLRDLVGGGDDGWRTRLPCRGEWRVRPAHGPTAACDKFRVMTRAEIAAEEAETAAMVRESEERFRKLGPLMERIKRENRGKDAGGKADCPICGAVLHWQHAGYNGHVRVACSRPRCIRFME